MPNVHHATHIVQAADSIVTDVLKCVAYEKRTCVYKFMLKSSSRRFVRTDKSHGSVVNLKASYQQNQENSSKRMKDDLAEIHEQQARVTDRTLGKGEPFQTKIKMGHIGIDLKFLTPWRE